MKKLVCTIFILMTIFTSFASDLRATTSDGRNVILHDNGKWEFEKTNNSNKSYYGKWAFTDDMMYAFVDQYLVELGISPETTEYSFTRAYLLEELKGSLGELAGIVVEFKYNNMVSVTMDNDLLESISYKVDDSTGLVSMMQDGVYLPFGLFSSDYSKLYLQGNEIMFMTKIE